MKNPPLNRVYPIGSLRELLLEAVRRYRKKDALLTKRHGRYQATNYQQLGERVRELGTALFRLGIQPGDRVAVLGPSCTEWAISYLASVCCGNAVVPIDTELRPREIRHILDYSGARSLIAAESFLGDYLNGSLPDCVKIVISMGEHPDDSVLTFPEVLQTGYEALQKGDCTFDDLDVKPEVPAAIIFTSGTTGNSKAVVLSHRNLSSNVIATSQFVSISLEDRLLSVLPLHHTYECTCGFLTALYQGATIFYAENLRRIQDNLAESRATVMLGVPLLFESFYKRIDKGIKERGEKKFRLAKGLAGLTEWVLRIDLRRRLFKELHAKLGGCLRLLISGGAAGNPAIARGFRALGVTLIQGYGLTETSPLISVNREGQCKDASVGRPIPGVEVRIVDGEIQVRGPNVMQGYYRNEAATQEVLTEGWLRTGDLGYLDQDGFLFINGRRKSLIVTPNGKNVYPEEIESILNESPHILESLVWGGPEIEPSLVEVQAIVVPDFEAFDRQFGAADYRDDQVYDSIAAEVKKCNQQLAKFKRIKKFTLREEEFEKTTTRKIKRYLYTQKPKILA